MYSRRRDKYFLGEHEVIFAVAEGEGAPEFGGPQTSRESDLNSAECGECGRTRLTVTEAEVCCLPLHALGVREPTPGLNPGVGVEPMSRFKPEVQF